MISEMKNMFCFLNILKNDYNIFKIPSRVGKDKYCRKGSNQIHSVQQVAEPSSPSDCVDSHSFLTPGCGTFISSQWTLYIFILVVGNMGATVHVYVPRLGFEGLLDFKQIDGHPVWKQVPNI